jgi:DNA-binding protein H-NS
MARQPSLTTKSIDELIKLRDSITAILSRKAAELESQIKKITTGRGSMANGSVKRGKSLKGRKVAPKYRSKKNPKLTWAGRGATPVWMREEMKAGKLKKDAFLIK